MPVKNMSCNGGTTVPLGTRTTGNVERVTQVKYLERV